MRVYFAGAIYGGREKLDTYTKIQEVVESLGHIFLTKHVTGVGLSTEEEKFGRSPSFSYKRDIKLLREADCLIAEITLPSLGVGYELAYAVEKKGLPVLALYEEGREHEISAMIRGNTSEKFKISSYDGDNLKDMIEKFLAEVAK
jgi:nucleoside 2-deoxyribosyltransferase